MDTGANIHVCADASLFSSYQVGGSGALLMGNGSLARVLGVGTVILKFTSGKMVLLKNVQHVPFIKKNLVSGSQCCRDGYKIVFESNKCVLSKYGTFVGKVMIVEACSAYPRMMMYVTRLRTMLLSLMSQIFGIHDFVTLILVVSRGLQI